MHKNIKNISIFLLPFTQLLKFFIIFFYHIYHLIYLARFCLAETMVCLVLFLLHVISSLMNSSTLFFVGMWSKLWLNVITLIILHRSSQASFDSMIEFKEGTRNKLHMHETIGASMHFSPIKYLLNNTYR